MGALNFWWCQAQRVSVLLCTGMPSAFILHNALCMQCEEAEQGYVMNVPTPPFDDGPIETEREFRLGTSEIEHGGMERVKKTRYRNWEWNAKWMEGIREKTKNRTEASVIVQTESCLSDLSLVLFPSALLPAPILSHVSPFSSALYQPSQVYGALD